MSDPQIIVSLTAIVGHGRQDPAPKRCRHEWKHWAKAKDKAVDRDGGIVRARHQIPTDRWARRCLNYRARRASRAARRE
jgi:hypothetical protein